MNAQLIDLLQVRKGDYRAHLSEIGQPLRCTGDIEAYVRLHFVLPDASGEPRFPELARMLVNYITLYCFDSLKRPADLHEVDRVALVMEARDLFRKAGRSGQAGEMLIYFLLEAVMDAPQVLRKMPLTTNPNEERKGSDGLHIKWNSELDVLDIYFAESKIWSNFSEALESAFTSVDSFHSGGMKRHELSLFRTHFKLLDSDLQTRILSYIDGENSPRTRTNHACLVGFDWAEYKCLDDSRRKKFIEEFQERYSQWAQDAVRDVESHIAKCRHKHLRLEFFFVPFKDVQQFRDWFEKALRG